MKTKAANIGLVCVLLGIVLLGAYISGVLGGTPWASEANTNGIPEDPGTRATEKVRIVAVTGRSATLTAGATTSLEFNITNVYGSALTGVTWDLSTESKAAIPSGISYTLYPLATTSFNLNASGNGSYCAGYLNITVSAGVTGADWDPCVLEAFVGKALTDDLTLTVTVGESHGVTLALSSGMSASITAIAGRPCVALIVVSNTGNTQDTYSLSATGQGTWDVEFFADLGIWKDFSTSRGIFDGAMDEFSDRLGDWTSLDEQMISGWDGFDDDAFVDLDEITEITVSAGRSRTFSAIITPPSTASVSDSQTITVTAQSQEDSTVSDTVDITVTIGSSTLGYAVSLSASSSAKDIEPGETVSFTVTVSGGTVAEAVMISVLTECPTLLGWDVVVKDDSGNEILEPGILSDVELGGFRGTGEDLTVSNTDMRSAVLSIAANGSETITIEITAPTGANAVPGITYGTLVSAVVVQDVTKGDILSIGADTDSTFTGSEEDRTTAATVALLGLSTMTLVLLGAAVLVGAGILAYWWVYLKR